MDNQPTQLQDNNQELAKPQSNAGRPSTVTESVIAKLIAYRQRGHSIEICCQLAGISEDAYYRRLKEDEQFRQQMSEAANFGKQLAADIVLDVLSDAVRGQEPLKDKKGNEIKNKYGQSIYPYKFKEKNRIDTARWYLERKEPEEFGVKTNTIIGVQNNNVSIGLRGVKDRMLARIEEEKRKATEAEVV